MIRMHARHRVEDFDNWRKVYDDFADYQSHHGVRSATVYRGIEDPLDITVYHDFPSMEDAQTFASSIDLREAMENAGVVGAPDIWFSEEA